MGAIGLFFFLLWLVARRRNPIAGPQTIEVPGSTLDPVEGQFSRILPMGVWALSLAQACGGLAVLLIFGNSVAAFVFLRGDTARALLVAVLMAAVALALPLWNLLLSTVPRGVSRVGGLPLLVLTVLGLILTPVAAISGYAEISSRTSDSNMLALYLALAIPAGLFGLIYAFGMARGTLSIVFARDRAVALMRATPSSRSLLRRILAQVWGLPPIFEYATKPWPRFVLIVVLSIIGGSLAAFATVLTLFGTQILGNTLTKMAGACAPTDCSGVTNAAALMIPVFLIVLPILLFLLGGLVQHAVRRLVRFSLERLQRSDPRQPILFLRAFRDDQVTLNSERFSVFGRLLQLGRVQRNLDQLLLEEVTPYGPHVALGNPKDPFPPYGAARGYFANKDWRQAVVDLTQESRAIILCVDQTDGVWWEVDHVAKHGHTPKTLFLLSPKYRAAEENRLLLARLTQALGIQGEVDQALAVAPPASKRGRAVPSVLGLFTDSQNRIRPIYSSSFSRLAFLLAVRLFIRSRIGLAPVPLA
jgi:hypothetical protein